MKKKHYVNLSRYVKKVKIKENALNLNYVKNNKSINGNTEHDLFF